MCKVYGYCRISRKEQNIERQERNIRAVYPDAIIRKEAFTGRKIDGRKEFLWILKTAEAGDTIVFDSVSRMSRNAEEGIKVYKSCFDKGINLVFLKEAYINTEIYASKIRQSEVTTGKSYLDEGLKVILIGLAEEQIKIAFEQAQKEVDDLRQRTREGIETVKKHNEMIRLGIEEGEEKQVGQKAGRKLVIKKAAEAKKTIRKHSAEFGGKLTDAETMLLAHVSKPTFYKYKREIRAELEAEAAAVEAAIDAEF